MAHRLFLGFVLATSVVTASRAGAAGDADRFLGTWTPAPSADAIVRDGVEYAIRPMNFLVRSIARKRLRDRFPPPGPMTFAIDGDVLVLTFAGARPQRIPLDGTPVVQDGVTFRVEFAGRVLRHTGSTSDGKRETLFEIDATGERLTMRTEIVSPRLPRPVRHTLEFERVSLPAS